MRRLVAAGPDVVVPGHGDISGPRLLADVRDHLKLLRDETWVRRDSAMPQETIVAEVRVLMIERHPEWAGQKWIGKGRRLFLRGACMTRREPGIVVLPGMSAGAGPPIRAAMTASNGLMTLSVHCRSRPAPRDDFPEAGHLGFDLRSWPLREGVNLKGTFPGKLF